ncbi:MAG: acetate/propionate family kinase, partial [Planctomycetaceae bacterium]|nr:acetate/propionate family kinase [Planctomycetaceae bacterium]
ACRSGLLGLSGLSGDVRDLEAAAAEGHPGAALALKTFVAAIRQYLAAQMAVLGGADVVVFTGGIGENSQQIREDVCRDMAWAGLVIDEERNGQVDGETEITGQGSDVAIWVVPTNEELIVARQTAAVVRGND